MNTFRSTSSTNADKGSWWKVDLGTEFYINMVVVYNRVDKCCTKTLNGAQVFADKTNCGTIKVVDGQSMYPMTCNGVKARYVMVKHTGKQYLQLAEVQVFGGMKPIKNISLLSLGQNAKGTSDWPGSNAKYAVDGSSNGYWRGKGLYISRRRGTPSKPQQLIVDISQIQSIYLVLVEVRQDRCCSHRGQGMKVYAGSKLCGRINFVKGQDIYPINCKGTRARVIKLVNNREFLEVAEVQVYGSGRPVRRSTGMTFPDTKYFDKIEGVEWLYKTNNRLSGRPLVNTIYDQIGKAMKACIRNPRCMGVSQINPGEFILGGTTREKPYPGMRYWLKRGKSMTGAGYSWSMFTRFIIVSPAINSQTFSRKKIALAECVKYESCKAVSFDGNMWTMRSGTEIKPNNRGQTWQKSYKLTTYGGYYYQPLSGFTYGWLNPTIYTDYYIALRICSTDKSCTGVTKIHDKKYRLNGGKTLKRIASYTLFKREGLIDTEFQVFYGGRGWKAYSPYELPGRLVNKIYTSRNAAFDACIQHPRCVGFTQITVNKFVLSGK